MATTFESRTLGIGIDRPFDAVHDFLSAPENFPKWAAGLGRSIRKADGDWIAETPHGPVRVRFTDRNPFGVPDPTVIPAPGVEIYVPIPVSPHRAGSEVTDRKRARGRKGGCVSVN